MPIVRRLTDSCVVLSTDNGATLIDPGFHTFDSTEIDLASIGDIQRVLITHEHGDHVKPEFVAWLVDRGEDVGVYANDAVAAMLATHEIAVETGNPQGVSSQDVLHEKIPTGAQPPNRSFTVEGVITHPGDSQQPTHSAPVLALPLLAPWTSMTSAIDFARRLEPAQVVPIHDFYTSASGRQWIMGVGKAVLAADGIEVVALDWGESYSL